MHCHWNSDFKSIFSDGILKKKNLGLRSQSYGVSSCYHQCNPRQFRADLMETYNSLLSLTTLYKQTQLRNRFLKCSILALWANCCLLDSIQSLCLAEADAHLQQGIHSPMVGRARWLYPDPAELLLCLPAWCAPLSVTWKETRNVAD